MGSLLADTLYQTIRPNSLLVSTSRVIFRSLELTVPFFDPLRASVGRKIGETLEEKSTQLATYPLPKPAWLKIRARKIMSKLFIVNAHYIFPLSSYFQFSLIIIHNAQYLQAFNCLFFIAKPEAYLLYHIECLLLHSKHLFVIHCDHYFASSIHLSSRVANTLPQATISSSRAKSRDLLFGKLRTQTGFFFAYI